MFDEEESDRRKEENFFRRKWMLLHRLFSEKIMAKPNHGQHHFYV